MLPFLNNIPTVSTFTDAFGGYNHNMRIGEGEFFDMENLTCELYPLASSRAPRGVFLKGASVSGIIGKDAFCYVDGTEFVCGDTRIELGLSSDVKSLVSMGAYVIILPDKKYVNTADLTDFGDIEAAFDFSGEVKYTLCRENGDEFPKLFMSSEKLTFGAGDAFWFDISCEPFCVRQYAASTGMWNEVRCGVRIEADGIGDVFSVGDSVIIRGFSSYELTDAERRLTVMSVGDGYITVSGLVSKVMELLSTCNDDLADVDGDGITYPVKPAAVNEELSVRREMPLMDFVIESGNRLWGCRYGLSLDGKFVNEIYVSKQSDFRNWNSFLGVSADSWAVTLGSDGPFTGAVKYGRYPLFFKEDRMIAISGDMPEEYSLSDIVCDGVMEGCFRSLSVVGNVLYYKARSGIFAYDGSLPVCISAAFGNEVYTDAVGGSIGGKYYVSMRHSLGDVRTFVYDTLRSMWHRESCIDALMYASYSGGLYYLTREGVIGTVSLVRGAEDVAPYGDEVNGSVSGVGTDVLGCPSPLESRVKWWCVSGLIGAPSPEAVYLTRLDVRLSLDPSSDVRFYIEYDSSGVYEPVGSCKGSRLGVFTYPIRARRCDHLRLRIEGEGNVRIFSLTKIMAKGSVRR